MSLKRGESDELKPRHWGGLRRRYFIDIENAAIHPLVAQTIDETLTECYSVSRRFTVK